MYLLQFTLINSSQRKESLIHCFKRIHLHEPDQNSVESSTKKNTRSSS